MTSYQIRLENCAITKDERFMKSLFLDLIDRFSLGIPELRLILEDTRFDLQDGNS